MKELDVSRYVLTFRVSSPQGILMSTKLLRRTGNDAPEPVRQAASRVRAASEKLHEEWKTRAQTRKPATLRNTMAELAAAWNALHARVSAWSKLPADQHAESTEATDLIAEVFSTDGLGFLIGDPGQQWLESDRRFEMITDAEHKEAFVRLAGNPFVTTLRKAHQAAGVVLGMTGEVAQKPSQGDLRALRDDLVQSIQHYAIKVIASADLQRDDEVARVAHMLEPIDLHRSRNEYADAENDDGEEKPAPAPDGTVRDAAPANDATQTPATRRVA